jgi:hypothetical protein
LLYPGRSEKSIAIKPQSVSPPLFEQYCVCRAGYRAQFWHFGTLSSLAGLCYSSTIVKYIIIRQQQIPPVRERIKDWGNR